MEAKARGRDKKHNPNDNYLERRRQEEAYNEERRIVRDREILQKVQEIQEIQRRYWE